MRVTGGGESKKKNKKKKVNFVFSADTVIAVSTVYETVVGMDHGPMIEQELEDHKVRMCHTTRLMDMCLDKLDQLNFDQK